MCHDPAACDEAIAYWDALYAADERERQAHRCPDCDGEGYVLDVWPNERQCAACGGTGLRAERSGDDGH